MSLESLYRIEPVLPSSVSSEIADLLTELPRAATRLGARLHPTTLAGLADLVRMMNCYYTNLIEGHHTRPRDIERALAEDYADEPERRNFQLEARAHIRLQRLIDQRFTAGQLPAPASADFLRWLHAEVYRDAPDDWLTVESDGETFRMAPGTFRQPGEPSVVVGRHQPPSGDRVDAFMEHFAQAYDFDRLGPAEKIVAMAAAHHRLTYIHPFHDGNGRVARLMSHAMGLHAGIGAHGLWSISRGLARGLNNPQEYKQMLDAADSPRRSDLDGRGNLSEEALNEFIVWFLRVCLDQIAFMDSQFEFDRLAKRLRRYIDQHDNLPPEAFHILDEILVRGSLARGRAARVTGLKERSARKVVSALTADGIIGSQTPKGALSLRFTTGHAGFLFPRLFD